MIDPAKSIPAFYAGQSIFVTGGTGFLGKVFIEKVLRSCPDVREIFLLMRPKREANINERLKKILNLPLFDKLREERPSNFEKLVPISGDVSQKELGLSVTDQQMLVERVSIIIHTAGDVKFNNSIKYAIFVNARSTRDICILGQRMKNLKALIHVSTAFSNVNQLFVEEKTYQPVADWKKMIEVVEMLDEHTLDIYTAKCLDYIPNTYIFSKNLAESIIQEYSSSLPCAIVRPSMVMPSLKEPTEGWIDNIYGPIGLFIGGGKGLFRVACLKKTVHENIVPVDIVINAIVIVTWKVGLNSFTADSTPFVLNCTSQKYITYGDVIKLLFSITKKEVPIEGIVWIPNTILIDNFVLFYILTILLHILPAILIDLILKSVGRRPMLLKLQRKLYVANRAVSYFSFHNWKYSNTNILTLTSSIPPDNLDTFLLDNHYDFRKYSVNSVIGAKKFILNEDINRLDAAKAHSKRVYRLVRIIQIVISIGILWMLF